MNPIVIDLSHWNPTPNWAQLVSAGTMGVIHKVTEGTTYQDPTHDARMDEAIDAGLMWASYHFLKHDDIAAQMEWYVVKAGLDAGDRTIIDYEDADCTVEDLKEAVTWLLDRRYEVTVYGNGHLSDTLRDKPLPMLAATSLWQARYSETEPVVPEPWKYWSLWQYSSKETVKGVSEPIDANKWNGNPDKLIEWFNGAAPAPEPQEPMVEVDIRAPSGVTVVVTVNGRERIDDTRQADA